MVTYCCVLQCKNKHRKGDGKKWHKFPRNKMLRLKWIVAIKSGKKPSKNAVVCSDHFVHANYRESQSGLTKVLNTLAIPMKNLPNRTHDKSPRRRRILQKKPKIPENKIIQEKYDLENIVFSGTELMNEPLQRTDDKSSQTEKRSSTIHLDMTFQILTEVEFRYFTGFDKQRFVLLYNNLNIHSSMFESYMNCKNQLTLTLIKYRQGLDFILIGKLFGLNRKIVSSIFSFWTEKIYIYLKKIDFWSFRYKHLYSYTAIVDCTEIFTERSSFDANINQELFSNYKNHNTFKYLIAIDEKGLITFCSKVYGGSKSDRFIFVDSKFLEFLKPGEIILADRGFNISDILEEKKVALNIPPFKTSPQFRPEEVLETRIIANRRIHVERVINLSKKNKILSHTIPASIWPQVNEIIYNANMLCNYKDRVIKEI